MNSLPLETLAEIFDWLTTPLLFKARIVCKTWCNVANTTQKDLISFNRRMLALFDRGKSRSPEYLTIQYETKLKNYRKNYEKFWLLMGQYEVTDEFRVVNYYYKKWGHSSFTIDMNDCQANLSLLKFKKKIIVWCRWRKIYGLVEDSHVVAENSKFSVLFEKLLQEVITI